MPSGYWTRCRHWLRWGRRPSSAFINVIDVLYEKQIRLLLVTRCDLETLVAGVELEDIQRTRSRLQQLPRAV